MTQLHSALFIDYDNVSIELGRYDPAIAARFSNKTLVWLDALEKHLPLPDGSEAEARRIVARRCYASPQQINAHRRNFTQTGFEVIDCPPLTTHLKNSADIYIVMDIVDYLQRYPHIDEYIILSADADFVPVLNRLRKELKKSVIFTSYNTTAAYRNCSDRTIEADFFAEHLAVERVAPRAAEEKAAAAAAAAAAANKAGGAPASDGEANARLASAVVECLTALTRRRMGRLPFASAATALRESMPADFGTSWAGRKTFTALIENIDIAPLEVDWDAQMIVDPDFHVDLSAWDEADRAALDDLVTDIEQAARKPVPMLRPADYCFLFEALASHYQGEDPGTFTHAINSVAERCREQGVDITATEVRFVATGISMQEYRFSEGADPAHLAALWRCQVYHLCGDPDWLQEPDQAARLAYWFHGPDETPEAGGEDFLRRTGAETDREEAGEAERP
jgi:hypothetical protein